MLLNDDTFFKKNNFKFSKRVIGKISANVGCVCMAVVDEDLIAVVLSDQT